MPQTHVSVIPQRGIAVVHGDFVRRSRIVPVRPARQESEDVAMNRAVWLAQQGRLAEAERYLEEYCSRAS